MAKEDINPRLLFPLLAKVSDRKMAGQAEFIWREIWSQCAWECVHDVPFNILTPGVSLVQHTARVVQGAVALAENLRVSGDPVDLDKVIIAAVLHDVSKLVEFGPGQEPGTAVKTDHGRRFQHGFYGAHWAMAVGLPDDIAHIILSHSGSTRTFPISEEGLLVLYADLADADICRLRAGAPLLVQRSRETAG